MPTKKKGKATTNGYSLFRISAVASDPPRVRVVLAKRADPDGDSGRPFTNRLNFNVDDAGIATELTEALVAAVGTKLFKYAKENGHVPEDSVLT